MPTASPDRGTFQFMLTQSGADGSRLVTLAPGGRLRLGRDPSLEVCLQDANISRVHAEIREKNNVITLRDLKSLNGTRLNGELIAEAILRPFDRVQLGPYVLQLLDTTKDPSTVGRQQAAREGGVFEVIHAIDLDSIDPIKGLAATRMTAVSLDYDEVRRSHKKLLAAYGKLFALMNAVARVGRQPRREQVSQRFLEALLQAYDTAETVAILQYSEAEDSFTIAMQAGQTDELQTAIDDTISALASEAMASRRAMYAVESRGGETPPDLANQPAHPAPITMIDTPAAPRRRASGRSMMVSQVSPHSEQTTLLYMENRRAPYCFDRFDLDLLALFAFHFGAALENAKLFRELDEAYARAATLFKEVNEDKKALLLELHNSERKFRALFEQSALGAALFDLNTMRVEEVNEGLVGMLGIRRRQLTGLVFADLLAEPSRAEAPKIIERLRREGEFTGEVQLQGRAGAPLAVLLGARPLPFGDRELMVCYFVDIGDRIRAEEENRTQLRRIASLGDFGKTLLSTLKAADIHRLTFEKVRETVPTNLFVVALRSEEDGKLRPAYGVTCSDEGDVSALATVEAVIPAGPLERVVAKGELVYEEIGVGETERLRNPFLAPTQPAGTHSRVYIPLLARDRVTGVLTAQSFATKAYDVAQIDFLVSLSTLAALALANAELYRDTREHQESLRQLSSQMLDAQEGERGRISRELHDGVGQSLTALRYHLETLRSLSKAIPEAHKLQEGIVQANQLVREVIEDLRRISLDLRPTMLDDLGLEPTIVWFARQAQERYELPVEFDVTVGEDPLPSDIATNAFRMIQEAVSNIVKHAQATRVKLAVRRERGELRTSIEDNGIGFDPSQLPQWQAERGCAGMLNMKERALLLGGTFTLKSERGRGTRLEFTLPIKETER